MSKTLKGINVIATSLETPDGSGEDGRAPGYIMTFGFHHPGTGLGEKQINMAFFKETPAEFMSAALRGMADQIDAEVCKKELPRIDVKTSISSAIDKSHLRLVESESNA